ncbi:hypothetical protein EW146_g7708 [Bondarzewia mesenterica]|uniref:Uncharacterized protein n=1 Tax=Bondarzewia mesenterica TaxID=1095465 RepID=A0A4S4LKM1_9AGAM|nr:hypothetical protein EW146_g7708 [Bondarzewia mesenterica]
MPPPLPPGGSSEPRKSPKPQPIGNLPFLLLFTTATICILFILWRRADALRVVVSHQLKTWSRREGNIRLSEDDGPPANSFLEDEYDDDNDRLDDEHLRLTRTDLPALPLNLDESPPLPPPKD